MGVTEGFMLGSIEQSVNGARNDINVTNENVLRVENKIDAILNGHYIPVSKYNELAGKYSALVEKHNALVGRFTEMRSNEVGNYQGREAAMDMIHELTGRDRDDILENEVHAARWDKPNVVAKTDEYQDKQIQADKDAGIY